MDISYSKSTSPNSPRCKFLVGAEGSEQQSFSVDKPILASASPIFRRLLYGNSIDDSEVILIPDITPYAFSAMLDYIYTNTVKIGSFENACELYSVANKYVLPEALFECSCYLLQSLNAKNICKAYEFSKLHNDPILKNKCIEMFPSLIKGIITDPSFMDIKLSTLREILSMDNLMISEIELFMGLRNYIIVNGYLTELSENNKKKIRFQNTQEGEIYQPDDITVQNSQRNIGDLKHAIRKIRFLLFTKEQFVEVVIKSGILSESEALAILLNIVLPLNKVCPMPDGFTTSKFRRYTHPLNYVDLDHVPWLIRRKLFN